MKKVILEDNLLIGKGSGRCCYLHPDNETKVIKVLYSKRGFENDQNLIDYKYINYLRKKKKNLIHIAACYEYIDTNLGTGLIFDKVVNYNQEPSQSLRYFIAKKLITENQQKKLLAELKDYLENEDIVFVDNCLRNILCQEISKGEFRLIIIDGLGAKREGLKFWMYLNFTPYRKYKIKRQWTRLLATYARDLERTNKNTDPIIRF